MYDDDHDTFVAGVTGDITRLVLQVIVWLFVAVVVVLLVLDNYEGIRQSWELGGPGGRHAEDIDPALRGAWGGD